MRCRRSSLIPRYDSLFKPSIATAAALSDVRECIRNKKALSATCLTSSGRLDAAKTQAAQHSGDAACRRIGRCPVGAWRRS